MKPVKRKAIKNFIFRIVQVMADMSTLVAYVVSLWLTRYLKMLWLHYLLLAPLIVALVIVGVLMIREWWAEAKLKAMDKEENEDDE